MSRFSRGGRGRRRLACAVWLLGCSLPGLASAQRGPGSGLQVGPGDVIAVQFATDSAPSGQFRVDDRGVVVLPFLGAREVTRAPWSEVRRGLLEAHARELRFAAVQLTPLIRVPVLGHVNKAGLYLLDPQVSVAGAIAMAQGATAEGDLRRVNLVRSGQTVVPHVPVEATVEQLDLRSGDQIFVGRRTWWDRQSGTVVAALISAAAILVSVYRP